ncbi:cytochrome c oxidase subunit II [Candidatus Spongiihabitans sp.]|uniref:cytochrome c oxidase subunit II n=1 Tax=Candidatus Spongiihabitans sp. TaxID=3101308 RepID=UPI003C7A8553
MPERMPERAHKRAAKVMLGLALWAISFTAAADWQLNLTQGITEISRRVYDMHMMVLWICVAIGILVFGAMAISIVMHRKSKGVIAATFHESITAEMLWTVVPFVILVAMAIPAAKTLIVMEDSSDADITIKITGHQWKWEYEYLNEGIRFISSLHADSREAAVLGSGIDPHTVDNYLLEVDKPMVLPVGKKIRFLLTANDVLHAWWLPALAIKKDAVPGFINEMWTKIDVDKVGVYRGQCAELCGRDHGFMPIVVEAKTEADYNQWVIRELAAAEQAASSADREWAMDELMAKGEAVYGATCAACHQANGAGIAGVFPGLVGSQMVLEDIESHIDIVMNGKPGTAMQAFAAQLGDVDIAAVITYERNAWGNDTGDAVQPAAVKAMR